MKLTLKVHFVKKVKTTLECRMHKAEEYLTF